ncbi:MAG: hypothetical protein ACLQU3_10345 [Limisphaerales bacterium]
MARRLAHQHPARVDQTLVPVTASGSSWPVVWQRLWNWAVGRRYELAALVLYAFVLVVRAPWVLVQGRFWGEEASSYFAYAWNHSFLDVLTAQYGYFNLVANVGVLLAAHVPLESAPRFTTALALLVHLIPAAAILFMSIPGLSTPLRKGSALLLLLVAPANPEVYLTTLHAQHVLCPAAGIILISQAGGRADRLGKWVILGLGGLSGIACTFLAPLFWVQWWLERRRERLIQASILSACALLQFVFINQAIAQDQRQLRFNSTVMVGTAYAKLIATPLAPASTAQRHLAQLRETVEQTGALPGWVWVVTAAGFGAFLLVCWRSGSRAAWLLAAAALWVALLSFCGTHDQALLAHMTHALRYYYAPQFFFLLALLVALAPGASLPPMLKALDALWLAAALLMGLVNFACGPLNWPLMFFGPPWAPQVEQWRKDPSKPFAIWPNGWRFSLPPKP